MQKIGFEEHKENEFLQRIPECKMSHILQNSKDSVNVTSFLNSKRKCKNAKRVTWAKCKKYYVQNIKFVLEYAKHLHNNYVILCNHS